MRVSLVSVYSNLPVYGLRSLSSCLKQAGHDVNLVFLPQKFTERYHENVVTDLIKIVDGSDLVGITTMSNHFDNAVQLTTRLKQETTIPVAWGGVHPTIRPLESLQHADLVCIGEGEEAIVELINKMEAGEDYTDTKGFWFKRNGEVIKNPIRPLIRDLDSIPFQDYDYDGHYVKHGDGIRPMTEELLNYHLQGDLMVAPTRGCPLACTFCVNNTLHNLYAEKKQFRGRSVDNIIEEVVTIREKLPFINHITFDDDAFFSLSAEQIEEFSQKFKNQVGLPLDIGGATPYSISREKLGSLVQGGLTGLRMGIQSAAESTKKQYLRNHSNNYVERAVSIIHEFSDKITPRYDIIINNPWETEEDLAETLLFLARVPAPFLLNMFSLTFYPATELYNKAVEDGIIKDDLNDVYRKTYNVQADGTSGRLLGESYMNNLFYLVYIFALYGHGLSERTMSVLVARKNRPIMSRLMYFFVRQKASLLLKKNLVMKTWEASTAGGSDLTNRLFHEKYAWD